MWIEKLGYMVVMNDGFMDVVIGRLSDFDLARGVYEGAVVKYPKRNMWLQNGARIIEQYLGLPPPEERPAPARLLDWKVEIIRGSRMDLKGYVTALKHEEAVQRAVEDYGLTREQRKRLVVTLRPGQLRD